MTEQAFICDAVRTPFGRYGGALSSVRTDDLGAIPIKALMARNAKVDWQAVGDVLYGCANQAGEDNRNVARMAALLAGLPVEVPGVTINRLCGSSLDAVGSAARAIKSGEAQLLIAGGVESMSRAPFVMPKAESAFSRANAVYDTTIGWRFVNKLMKERHGVDSMPETAENVATDFKIEREAQDRMALASQLKAVAAQKSGFFDAELTPVSIAQKKGEPIVVTKDEHPRETSLEALAKLKGVVRPDGTVTAGNASGVNDGVVRAADRQRRRRREARPDAARAHPRHGDRRRRAADHGLRPGAGEPQGARADRHRACRRSTSSSSTRRSPRKASRCCATSASPTTTRASIRTAARSRSAIRSARAAPASSRPRCTSCSAPAAAMRSARCASASARASRS